MESDDELKSSAQTVLDAAAWGKVYSEAHDEAVRETTGAAYDDNETRLGASIMLKVLQTLDVRLKTLAGGQVREQSSNQRA